MTILFTPFTKVFKLDSEQLKFYNRWLLISAVLIFIAALCSTGFHHFDEQWQIFEFLGLKLGKTSKELLPWEYHNQMRSWAQPFLYYLSSKALFLENPFWIALVSRLVTAFIGWYALGCLSICSMYLYRDFDKAKWATYCLSLFWFIPYLKVRPSSEGLSASVFIIGLSLLITQLESRKYNYSSLFISGLVCGLSFLFRFQMGFLILFTWIWLVLFSTIPFKKSFLFALGVCFAVAIELPIDIWGYETFSFAPWNYFYQNLVLDKASGFPTAPWYDYFISSFHRGIPPLSIVLIITQVLFWIFKPKSIFTWATLPLFIVHSLIPAKASRYLFPLAVITPLFIPWAHTFLVEKLRVYRKFVGPKFIKAIIAINLILLTQSILRSSKSTVGLYKYVYDQSIKEVHYKGESPYSMVGLELMFYRQKGLELRELPDFKTNLEQKYLISKKGKEIFELKDKGCELKYSNYPTWVLNYNAFGWVDRSRIWSLFYCP